MSDNIQELKTKLMALETKKKEFEDNLKRKISPGTKKPMMRRLWNMH